MSDSNDDFSVVKTALARRLISHEIDVKTLESGGYPLLKGAYPEGLLTSVACQLRNRINLANVRHFANEGQLPLNDPYLRISIQDVVDYFPDLAINEGKLLLNNQGISSFDGIENLNDKFDNFDSLNLSGNKLREIPADVRLPWQLTYIDLSRNVIESIPPEVLHFKKIKKLILKDNKITEIPKETSGYSSLWALNLSNNNLEILPEELSGDFSELRVLCLDGNKLNVDKMPLMPELLYLSMKNTNLEKIPSTLFSYKQLMTLDLSSNKISKVCLDELVSELPRLSQCHLQYNEINDVNTISGISDFSRYSRVGASAIGDLVQLDLRGNLIPEEQCRVLDRYLLRRSHIYLRGLPIVNTSAQRRLDKTGV